ncbi:MAG TPA: hypothetical protein VMM78_13330 [Thermomicrobiales bacterium]|nr:hypothetical protein [Thermomicrobiales bacterium]
MSATEWYLVGLRLAHALAAVVWLGGGVYYLIAMRPAMRDSDDAPVPFISASQRHFGEWARVCTLAMLATGVVLAFERLSGTDGGVAYIALLAAKILAALSAFWIAGFRPRRRGSGAARGPRSKPEIVAALGLFAFAVGVIISSAWGDR